MRALAGLALLLLAGSLAAAPASPRLDLTRFVSVEEMHDLLEQFQAAYPSLATLRSIGRSREGRDLWALEIFNPATGAARDKAAMYIDANMHGNEIQGTEVTLYTIKTLLDGHGSDPLATRLVDERVFLILPCVNPDGRAHFLDDPNTPHSNRWNRRPHDEDHDGRVDEDGYEDLDGDGEILQMRRRAPGGNLVTRDDPRLLERATIDETGEWERLGDEGIDSDGDGRVNEDGPGGVDLNRNFPSGWAPDNEQYGAGPYPLSEPETRAIVEYILEWPNLAAMQSFHNFGGMILRPPGSASDRDAGIPHTDREVFDALGRRGEELLPGYRYLQTHDQLYPVKGGFLDWGYLDRGIIFFTNELWDFPQDYDGDGKVTERERLRWNDIVLGGAGYATWKPFQHPTYGPIEIGGWRKLSRRIPPAFQMEEMCYRNTRFTLIHADQMPKVEISGVAIKSFSNRLHQIDVTVVNRGLIPTSTAMAWRRKVALDDLCILEGRHVTVLGSGLVGRDDIHAGVQDRDPARARLGSIGSRGAVTARFLVEGWSEATVRVESQKGGIASQRFTLKEE